MAWCTTDFGYNCTQPSKPDSITATTHVPWTAARCQRLLRPLSARIALLRKEKQTCTVIEEDRRTRGLAANSDHHIPALSFGSRRRKSEKFNAANEEWAPNPRRSKKIKRTYSARSSSSQYRNDPTQLSATDQHVHNQAEITIPREIFQLSARSDIEDDARTSSQDLARDQRDEESESQSHVHRGGEHSGRPSRGHSRCLYSSTISFERRLMDGIYKGVSALLLATNAHSAQIGARSLFNACLRSVPDYIAQEEIWNHTEDPESNIDVASIVYNDLESLSTSEYNGWDPLRQVVRAHGMSMIASAVSEGLIESYSFHSILRLCIHLGANDEAQHLLERLVLNIQPMQKHSNLRWTLVILDEFVSATGRHSFRYKSLSRLLSSGGLSPDWMSRHETIDTWNKIVQSVSQRDEHAGSAAELLRLAITMTYGLAVDDPAQFVHGLRLQRSKLLAEANEYFVNLEHQVSWPRGSRTTAIHGERDCFRDKTSATISSLMTVLCAIGLLRSAATRSGTRQAYVPNVGVLQDIATDAQQFLELASERISLVRNEGMAVPLLAAGLVKATLCHRRDEFADTVPNLFDKLMALGDDESTVEQSSSFLCAVAECCARGTSEDTFDHTQKIVQHIHHIGTSLKSVSRSHGLCNRIGVAAALEYAESTKHPKHLHWALDVEQAITGVHLESVRRTPARTPLRGQKQTQTWNGYRWESGICEWVARTPAIAVRKPPTQEQLEEVTQSKEGRSRSVSKHSSCSSKGPYRTTHHEGGSHRERNLRSSSSRHLAKVSAADEESASEEISAHDGAEMDDDELSMSERWQEAQAQAQAQAASCLRAVTKVAAKPRGQTSKTGRRRGRRGRRSGSTQAQAQAQAQATEDGMPGQDMALDSEDELSFLGQKKTPAFLISLIFTVTSSVQGLDPHSPAFLHAPPSSLYINGAGSPKDAGNYSKY
ncbi:MAG: hypothetical protein Q9210_005175 [Variospora velana]